MLFTRPEERNPEMTAKIFRPVSNIKDLREALEDGFARLTGEVFETPTPNLVDIRYVTDNFGAHSLMRVSRATARKLGLTA